MATPDQVPEEIAELFEKFRNYQTTEAETMQLTSWIVSMLDVPGFNYKHLCMDGFGYNIRDYNRLKKAVERAKKKLSVTAETQLKKLEASDFARFIEDLWSEVSNIGKSTVMKFVERAKEMGYFDEEKGRVRMKDFVEDACNFYIENKDLIETVEERVKDVEAVARVFAEIAKPNILRIIALREYTRFITEVTRLAALGIPVPESIILEVKETINKVITSTYPALKEEQVYGE
jgi:hypothetical protein